MVDDAVAEVSNKVSKSVACAVRKVSIVGAVSCPCPALDGASDVGVWSNKRFATILKLASPKYKTGKKELYLPLQLVPPDPPFEPE